MDHRFNKFNITETVAADQFELKEAQSTRNAAQIDQCQKYLTMSMSILTEMVVKESLKFRSENRDAPYFCGWFDNEAEHWVFEERSKAVSDAESPIARLRVSIMIDDYKEWDRIAILNKD